MGVLKIKIFKDTANTSWKNHCSKDLSGMLSSWASLRPYISSIHSSAQKTQAEWTFLPHHLPCTPGEMYCRSSLLFWSLRPPLAGYIGDMPSGSSIQQLSKVLWPHWTWNSLNRKVVAWHRNDWERRPQIFKDISSFWPGACSQSSSHQKNQGSTGSGKECLSSEISSSKPVHAANQGMTLRLCERLNIALPTTPKEVHVLVPRTCECVVLYNKRDFISKLRILRWESFLHCPSGLM